MSPVLSFISIFIISKVIKSSQCRPFVRHEENEMLVIRPQGIWWDAALTKAGKPN